MTPARFVPKWIAAAAVAVMALASSLVPAPQVRADDSDAADDASATDPGPWEEVVFLPESGLSVLLERDPRGVLLDRASYLDLYRRARAARGGTSGATVGRAAQVVRCEADGVVAGEMARVRRPRPRSRGPRAA